MTRCSVQPRDRIFIKGYGFLSVAKNVGKNIGKITIKNLCGKCSQKPLGHAKHSAADALRTTLKRVIQEIAESICDLIGNRIANRITKVLKNLQQNKSETVTNDNNKETPKER